MGAIVTFIAKQLSAVKISEFRPVASICAKFAIFMDIINKRLARFLEDHGLLEDAQEAFRKNRSTQRQLCKLQCLLAAQRRANFSQKFLGYAFSWYWKCLQCHEPQSNLPRHEALWVSSRRHQAVPKTVQANFPLHGQPLWWECCIFSCQGPRGC